MQNLSNTLVSQFGLDKLPEEKQKELLDRIGTIIYQAVLMRCYDVLTDTQKEEIEAELAKGDGTPETLFVLFAKAVPNFEHIVDEEIARFKAESIDLFKKLA